MNIQIHDARNNMSNLGHNLLDDLQDKSTPEVDLLVREAIQNSLDAGMATNGDTINVDFFIGDFNNQSLIPHFEGIESALQNYQENPKFIAIKDSGTEGLTGKMSKLDLTQEEMNQNRYGNLIKLVYDIRKAQDRADAGGAWGLGKTIYYRLGLGLAIFYSRIINTEGKYESRLAACMVEDERVKMNIPCPNGLRSGIAWWGEKISDDKTIPITNQDEIKEIIDIFGIHPYINNETGTTVIIPYVDENKLLDTTRYNIETEDHSVQNNAPIWYKSLDECIETAIQRWYYARINNYSYKYGKYLEVKINGKQLLAEDMAPVFQLLQSLYNRAALYNNLPSDYSDFISDNNNKGNTITAFVKEVNLNKVLTNHTCGYISYATVNKSTLGMLAPDYYESPHRYFDLIPEDKQSAVIAFCRKPGMTVWFASEEKWMKDIPSIDDNTYLIGQFVLNTTNTLKDNGISLEEYMRGREKANHRQWEYDNLKIVFNTEKNTAHRIIETFVSPRNNVETINSGLGGMATAALLPPNGFGNKASISTKASSGKGGTGKTRNKDFSAKLPKEGRNVQFKSNSCDITYDIEATRDFNMEIAILTESGTISLSQWEDDLKLNVPFQINEVQLKNAKIDGISHGNLKINEECTTFNDVIEIALSYNMQTGSAYGASVKLFGHKLSAILTIKLSINSRDVNPIIEFK